MELKQPIKITPRLLPGVKIGDVWISIKYARNQPAYGRTRYHWFIDLPDGTEFEGANLKSGCHGGNLQSGLTSLLSFLQSCGESVAYSRRTGRTGENSEMFPQAVAEWADQYSDDIGMLSCDLQEQPELIVE